MCRLPQTQAANTLSLWLPTNEEPRMSWKMWGGVVIAALAGTAIAHLLLTALGW